MNQKRVFIIHGWAGHPQENWFPWLKRKLERHGVQVTVPALPNPTNPEMSEWVSAIAQVVGQPDENTFLVGHSLGCIAILRYLEGLPAGQKVGGAVLVAGFSESIGIPEIKSFFVTALDYQKVKNTCSTFIAVNSTTDPFVPLEKGTVLRDKLSAELIVVPDAGHLNQESGFLKLPIILKKIVEVAGLKKWFWF